MAEKKLVLQIEGKDTVLNYGVNWFFEHFKTDSGLDLIKDSALMDVESTEFFKYLQSFIWAGYLSGCSVKGEEPVMERKQVEAYVMGLDEQAAVDLFFKIAACRSGVSIEQFKSISAEKEVEEEKKN